MHGSYRIRIRNSKNSYAFELRRNITLLRGESGRGKTTLFDMIRDHNRYGKQSGVTVSCDRGIFALDGDSWEETLRKHGGEIIIVDEDSHFIRSEDFARAVKGSDNYFLLITRNYLPNPPVSVDEIYELSGKKNKRFKPMYKEVGRMYNNPSCRYLPFRPDVIVTEDSGSGFDFFREQANRIGIACVSARGKNNVYKTINSFPDKSVVAIADGAAFGNEMEGLVRLQELRPRRVAIFLPESFEWVILNSDLVRLSSDERLTAPEEFADSTEYMNFEQYFTALLEAETAGVRYMKYSKSKLPDYYLQDDNAAKIRAQIEGIALEGLD